MTEGEMDGRLAVCDECGQIQTVIFDDGGGRSLSTDGPCYSCGSDSFSPVADSDAA